MCIFLYKLIIYSPPAGAGYCEDCGWMSVRERVSRSSEARVQTSPKFLSVLPAAAARYSSGGVAMSHVLPVLRMTLYLHIMVGQIGRLLILIHREAGLIKV